MEKIKNSIRQIGGLGIFAARAYVNYKYPMAKPTWKKVSKETDIPYVEPFLDWFFKV